MPAWDFKCEHCHHVEHRMFPTFAKMEWSQEQGILTCEKCGCQLHRQHAAPAFKLVGSGFHANDYKKG